MVERIVAITVSGQEIRIVDVECNGVINVLLDENWPMQNGDRPAAYSRMAQAIQDYLNENKVSTVIIKGSRPPLGRAKPAHLEAAELRGVVMAACSQSDAQVVVSDMANISRNFGDRKRDEYIDDDEFWDEHGLREDLRKGSRETALLILNARKQ